MAIRLVTGVPGAGKSYYMVNRLANKYCKRFGDVYSLKKKYVIVTNIDNLLLDVVDLDDAIKRAGGLERFFSMDVQKKVTEKYQKENKQLIYIVDEAQKYFHRRFYDREVFTFFESHRHLGLDVFLLTQNSNLLPKDLISLVEIEVRAVPRTLSIAGFNYLRRSNKDIIGREFLRKKKHIFLMYKSMSAGETEKIRSPYLKYIIPVLILFAIGFYGLNNSFFGRAAKRQAGLSVPSAHATNVKLSSKEFVQSNADNFKAELQRVSFLRSGRYVQILNPITQKFVPAELFPYRVKAIIRNKHLILYAAIPQTSSVQAQEKGN